jgi:hypothetical protein
LDNTASPIRLAGNRVPQIAFWAVVALLAMLRWLHFGPDIDLPHDWRQFDTAQYIRSFSEDGFDLMHPSVAWMGGHKTLILEFPLHEALVALLYRVFGPDILWARLVTWLFFSGGCLYLYGILRRVAGEDLARLTTCVYMVLPLGFFYSRAVHIDFAAVFFAHGMVYHLLESLGEKHRYKHLGLAMAWTILGFLVKVPYVFYLILPCLAYAWRQGQFRPALLRWSCWLSPAIVLFGLWTWHTRRVNAAAPDWYFIPHYSKFDDMWGWYFGTLDLRWMPMLWERILDRIRYEVAGGFPGIYLALLGFCFGWRRFGLNFMRWWLLGTVCYLLIFFPLNFNHDYYQIPFLVPVAFFVAVTVEALAHEIGKLGTGYLWAVRSAFVLLLMLNTWRVSSQLGLSPGEAAHFSNYFQVDRGHIDFGNFVDQATRKDALVVASSPDLDCRAPHLLYLSHRYGWSIRHKALQLPLLDQLKAQGASYLAVYGSQRLSPIKMDSLTQAFPLVRQAVLDIDGNQESMLLLDLNRVR